MLSSMTNRITAYIIKQMAFEEEKMLKVLIVTNQLYIKGGIEALLMDIARNIDKTRIHLDFLVQTDRIGDVEAELESLGGNVIHAPEYMIYNYIQCRQWWKDFLNKNHYDIIHAHYIDSAYVYFDIARKNGIRTIVHSHNTKSPNCSLSDFFGRLNRYPARFISDYYVACSIQAGIDKFGKKITRSKNFKVLYNGIKTERFRFDPLLREGHRRELNIPEDYKVIISVGRLCYQKNQEYGIKVFEDYHRDNPESVFLIIGAGADRENLQTIIKERNLEDSIFLIGIRNDVNELLITSDLFLFPSRFEGFPIALIEAQASGIRSLASDKITKEADLDFGLVSWLSIDESPAIWANKIEELLSAELEDRSAYADKVKDKGFDISSTVQELTEFYIKIIDGDSFS